jgi:hypothetical protein
VCLNIAGFLAPHTVQDATTREVHLHVDVNLKGVVFGTRCVALAMVDRGIKGHIVNMSSLGAVAPVSGVTMYIATKCVPMPLVLMLPPGSSERSFLASVISSCCVLRVVVWIVRAACVVAYVVVAVCHCLSSRGVVLRLLWRCRCAGHAPVAPSRHSYCDSNYCDHDCSYYDYSRITAAHYYSGTPTALPRRLRHYHGTCTYVRAS